MKTNSVKHSFAFSYLAFYTILTFIEIVRALVSIRFSLMVIFRLANFQRGSNTDYPKCCREIAASLNDFINRWCK